ncbi:hypothetical protein EAH77_22410 [Ewingella americana]|uniref:Uncharacterized protein n=2 Tax=Ewingella americana TaxID=41202 RepID=A0A502G4J7_9GAMM|nr:hypothetical protein EAH77_22410 [Ewingella americana]
MFLSECKNNRIPYVILCLITLGFYGTWAYELHYATPADWSDWRFALIAGGIYLGLIYASAIDFSVINTLCMMAALWGVMAIVFVLCAFLTWKLPHLGPSLINDILKTHFVISLMSAVWGQKFQFVKY